MRAPPTVSSFAKSLLVSFGAKVVVSLLQESLVCDFWRCANESVAWTPSFLFIQQQHSFQKIYVVVTVTFHILPGGCYAVVMHRAALEGLIMLYKQPQNKNPLWGFYRMKLHGAFRRALRRFTIVISSCNL